LVEEGIWRIGNNQELRELCQGLDITKYITQKRLEWIGYVVRMGQGRAVKKYLRLNRRKVEEGEDQD